MTVPLRILLISKEGDGLGIAQRLAFEGNNVDVFIAEPRFNRAGRGLVNRVSGWAAPASKADLIIIDCVGMGKFEQRIRGFGAPVLGISEVLDRIELDRALGMQVFQRAGVTIPETYEFNSTEEADKLCKSQPWQDGWVIKPNNNISTSKTMVVKNETMWDQSLSQLTPSSSGILQRCLSGIEVSTEGWFNGTKFIEPFNHTFEEKRFLAGGLGVNTGCMGNVVLNANGGDRLVRDTVLRLEPLLASLDYHGPLDINCIVREDGAYALEATSRIGYDAVEALAEGLNEPLGIFLLNIASGASRNAKLTTDTMIAVRLSVPPWPVRKPDADSHGELVDGIDDDTLPHLFLTDLYKDNEGYKTAAGDGVLLKATAIGRARKNGDQTDYTYEARRRVYRTLDKIAVRDKQYRPDIGDRVNGEVKQLKQWGWL